MRRRNGDSQRADNRDDRDTRQDSEGRISGQHSQRGTIAAPARGRQDAGD